MMIAQSWFPQNSLNGTENCSLLKRNWRLKYNGNFFRNLHSTVRVKRNLVAYFTHVSDVGCLIPKLSWNLIFNLIGPLSSELHWVYLEQVSLCVRAGILCQGQTIIVLLGPLENSSNRHIIHGNSYIIVFVFTDGCSSAMQQTSKWSGLDERILLEHLVAIIISF